MASRRIDTAFPDIPAFVRKWSQARWLLELAEGFALERRYPRSARLVAECLACDFVRTSTFLGYRLKRRFSNGRRRAGSAAGPLFAECATEWSLIDLDTGRNGARLRAMDAARLGTLETVDRAIAERRGARAFR